MSPPPADTFAARIFLGPALRAQPDRRLVDLVRNGYDAAFEEIVRRYRRPLDRFAAAIVGGRSEDVTQDAFSKALPALRGTDQEIELRPWLYRIVRNTALNDLRDQAPPTAELSESLPGGLSAAAEAEAHEELADLMERLQALPEPQRAALVMRELEGLSHEEIAVALGVSGGAARQAIFRARAALRSGLGLVVPMPILRALVEHGDAAAAGGAVAAGAGASSAGGAVLGGLGGGTAAKVGVATVLVAGTVGAGVAIEQRGGDHGRGPEAAQAAPATPGAREQGPAAGSGSSSSGGGFFGSGSGGNDDSRGPGGGDDDRRGEDRGDDDDRDQEDGRGRGRGRGRSGDDSTRVDSSGSSGSGSRHSSDSDDDDNSGSGSGSGSSGSGSSGSSGDLEIEDNDSSGPGSGDEIEVEPAEEPEVEELESDDNSGSGGGDDED